MKTLTLPMNPRERFRKAINHEQPDRPPIDLGATWVTGISASAYARLRRALIFPRGDRSAQPSGCLPKGGSFFDAIIRQEPIDEDHLDPKDWADSFTPFSDADLVHFEKEANLVAMYEAVLDRSLA